MLIGGYQPCSLCDYPGHVAAVVFTQGCNFRCPFCHNQSLLPLNNSTNLMPLNQVLDRLGHQKNLLNGVVISGGEPTLQKALFSFLETIHSLGLAVKIDTNGSRPDVLRRLIATGLIDYVAMDVKAPWPKYDSLTGTHTPIESIIESMDIIANSHVTYEFRTTFIPNLLTANDLEEIKNMLPWGSLHRIQKYREPPKV